MPELSIGELDSLVQKAYRGAGFSWGLSQEAGRAAAWMAIRRLPAAKCFADLLRQIDGIEHAALLPEFVPSPLEDGQSKDKDSPCCPVIAGTVISDFGWPSGQRVVLGPVYSALIILPFVSYCSRASGVDLCATIGEEIHHIWADGQLMSSLHSHTNLSPVVLSELPAQAVKQAVVETNARRASVAEPELNLLETLAHRTYVPASEASRSGAGAGLTDND